jgi:hypothetical protein
MAEWTEECRDELVSGEDQPHNRAPPEWSSGLYQHQNL